MIRCPQIRYLSLCCSAFGFYGTRTSAQERCAPIVETLKKARRGVGVSCEPAKLSSQEHSPREGKDNPPAMVADSAEHMRPTIMS